MSLSTKIAIGAIIVWIGSIVIATFIGPPDYELPEEKQRQIKFILITLQFFSLYSIPIAMVAGVFAYAGHKNRKLAERYAKERAERAAAAELENTQTPLSSAPVDPRMQSITQLLSDICASTSSAQIKHEAETLVDSIQRAWDGGRRDGEEFKDKLAELIVIAEGALKGTDSSALQTMKKLLGAAS